MSVHRRRSDATRSARGHEIAEARTAVGLREPHRSVEAPCAFALRLRLVTPAHRVSVGMKVRAAVSISFVSCFIDSTDMR